MTELWSKTCANLFGHVRLIYPIRWPNINMFGENQHYSIGTTKLYYLSNLKAKSYQIAHITHEALEGMHAHVQAYAILCDILAVFCGRLSVIN